MTNSLSLRCTCGHGYGDHFRLGIVRLDCLTAGCACETYVPGVEVGQQLARQGAAAAYANAGDVWRRKAKARIRELIKAGVPFTSEDVVEKVGPAPSRNAMGGLFNGYRDQMEVVGYTQASRPEAHARVLRIWKAKA